jgi:Na+-transporting NADH:ubiquinone oxidoreductase subunit NqrB
MLLKDARDYQILFLSTFLVLGIATRDWTLRLDVMAVAIATCLFAQILATKIFTGTWQLNSLKSAAITALSLCLLLRVDHYTTMVLAGSLAIFSKFILQVNQKHFFNPANFGIISALALTQDAWVSPGQWGDDWWYALLFLGCGGMVLSRVGRLDTAASFFGSYALFEGIRNIYLGWTWDVYVHRLMSGSLLLFALFMITDPRSVPNAQISRLIWGTAIALVTFLLRNYFFVAPAVFWALFALSPLTIILDLLWSSPQFAWLKNWIEQPNQQIYQPR